MAGIKLSFKFAAASLILLGCSTTTKLPTVDQKLAEEEAFKQRVLAFNSYRRHQTRFFDVAFRILKDNAELCGDATRLESGIHVATANSMAEEYREVARTEGITERLNIIAVMDSLPAALVGIRVGDEIVKIDGRRAGLGQSGFDRFWTMYEESIKNNGTIDLEILRNGETLNFRLSPVSVCDYGLHLAISDQVNAFADGENVLLTTGMLRFTESDDALALIVAHELGHNIMGHIRKKKRNSLLGGLIGAVVKTTTGIDAIENLMGVGAGAFSQDFEAEADYVGAYYASRAGFNLTEGVNLWRLMATEHPQSIDLMGSTHPSTARRFLSIENTIKEIENKRIEGLPIEPTLKKK